MYKLLIVDDEKQVREGLKRLLPWQDYGITIIGEAINGREALEIIKAQRPDIVLLDIQMPVMNGLELAERIHGQYPECKFVVLSGYNDFARVREAMRYGAVDYLLKPSGKEEIIRTIEEIIDSLEDSLISRLHNSEYLALLKNNVLNRLVSGTISSRELKDRLALLQLDLSSGCFGIASVEIAKDKNMVEDDASWQIFNVCNICDEIMVQSGKGVAFTDFSGRVNMIIKDFSGWSTDTQLKNLLESCIGEIKKRLKLKVTIAVGNQVSSTRKMYVSYKNALRTLSYRFIFGSGTVLYYDEINEYFEKTPGVVSIDSDRFREWIKEGSFQPVDRYVRDLFENQICRDPMAEIYVLKNSALELSGIAFECLSEDFFIDQNEIADTKNQSFRNIMNQVSPEGIQNQTLEILKQVIEMIATCREKTLSKPVFDSIQFIEKNYSNLDISLQYLADDFHISTAYLGKLFKKEIGSSFNDYLNTFRIRKAEKLLLSTNFKGKELAEKVGFSSYNYFYMVFKKITGQRPMDIRKNILGKP